MACCRPRWRRPAFSLFLPFLSICSFFFLLHFLFPSALPLFSLPLLSSSLPHVQPRDVAPLSASTAAAAAVAGLLTRAIPRRALAGQTGLIRQLVRNGTPVILTDSVVRQWKAINWTFPRLQRKLKARGYDKLQVQVKGSNRSTFKFATEDKPFLNEGVVAEVSPGVELRWMELSTLLNTLTGGLRSIEFAFKLRCEFMAWASWCVCPPPLGRRRQFFRAVERQQVGALGGSRCRPVPAPVPFFTPACSPGSAGSSRPGLHAQQLSNKQWKRKRGAVKVNIPGNHGTAAARGVGGCLRGRRGAFHTGILVAPCYCAGALHLC
eukprot:gb/GEZN01006270.1/.p1 GENE.gb/GEZN01006270.1/~~gb/GEZN01006270.1/.p1  ORF type:complete len:335 (+),score=28.54 gb/GEZN01006270.1/:40-1005(+)